MPHLVIEYSEPDFSNESAAKMLHAAHAGAVASGLFDVTDIKVRAYPCELSLLAGKAGSFIHVTVLLLSGRDAATQKKLAETVLTHLSDAGFSPGSLSVDCQDMDRAVYSKITR